MAGVDRVNRKALWQVLIGLIEKLWGQVLIGLIGKLWGRC